MDGMLPAAGRLRGQLSQGDQEPAVELRFGVTVAFVIGMVAATLLSPDAPSSADGKGLPTPTAAIAEAVAVSAQPSTVQLLRAANLPWLYAPMRSN